MLTDLELRKVNELMKKKGKLQEIIRDFNGNYTQTSVGLITVVNSSQKYNDSSVFLYHHCPDIVKDLNEQALKLLKSKLLHVEADLSKYIKPE